MDDILPGIEFGYALGDAFRSWRNAFDQALVAADLELTPGEVRTLACIIRKPGIRCNQVASLLGVEAMTASTFIARLEAVGYIAKRRDPSDRRALQLHLTPSGEEFFARTAPIAEALFSDAFRGIDERQRGDLLNCLRTLRGNLADASRPATG